MRNIYIFFIVVFVSMNLIGCTSMDVSADTKINNSIVRIAKNAAVAKNYPVEKSIVKFERDNATWNEYIQNVPFMKWNPEVELKLRNKDYYAVYFYQEKWELDGDFWVIIDKASEKLIMTMDVSHVEFYNQ